MKWILTVLLVILVAVVSGGGAYWLTRRGPDTRVTVTVQSIRKVAQLATVEYSLGTVVDETFKSNAGFGIMVDSSKMLAMYSGNVKGFLDLAKVDIKLKEVSSGASDEGDGRLRASIHFPRGSILVPEVAIDPSTDQMMEKVYWVKPPVGVYHPPNEDQREQVRRQAYKTILETAIKKGIVKKTKDCAEMVLSEFLSGFGIQLEITFDENAYNPSDPNLAKLAKDAAKD